MISFLDKLNLNPQEKRLVVLVTVVLFVVLNILLVWPHFKDWKLVKSDLNKARTELQNYKTKIGRIPVYEAKLAELESKGSSVVADENQLDLVRTVEAQSRLHSVIVTRSDSVPRSSTTVTNQFFEEQELRITVSTGNEELVNFLVSLASTNSLIRVKDLDLRRDPSGTKLTGVITLVASYQKNPLGAPASPGSQAAVPPPVVPPRKIFATAPLFGAGPVPSP